MKEIFFKKNRGYFETGFQDHLHQKLLRDAVFITLMIDFSNSNFLIVDGLTRSATSHSNENFVNPPVPG